MKILIVGGAGFIGSNLAEHLVKTGHEVFYNDAYMHDNTQNKPEGAVELNYGNYFGEYDLVYWLGGKSSAPMFSSHYDVAEDVQDFAAFLDSIRTDRLVVASTSSFYEDPPSLENEIIRPKTYYEATKRCFEEMACNYARMTGIDTVVARFFSVYGPGEAHKRNYANLITQMVWSGLRCGFIEDEDAFEIYGDGEQTRDFTHVSDIVSGLETLGFHDAIGNYDIYNIGTGKSYSLNAIADYIQSKIPEFKYKWVPNRINNYVNDTQADLDKISHLGYAPKISVWEGIDQTIGDYRV